jgi:CPA2 family monovalent cation:H+ antiporter-2
MEVGYSCPFVGERLKNSGLRSRFGVNVVSIQRGGTVYNIPDADMRIFPGDVLGIVGTDLQIQRLLPIVEQSDDEMFASSDEYHFTNFLLPEESMLVGKTSASASVRNTYHVLVVAIRRGEEYIDVTPDTVFEAGDILWVAGPRNAITELKDK